MGKKKKGGGGGGGAKTNRTLHISEKNMGAGEARSLHLIRQKGYQLEKKN